MIENLVKMKLFDISAERFERKLIFVAELVLPEYAL